MVVSSHTNLSFNCILILILDRFEFQSYFDFGPFWVLIVFWFWPSRSADCCRWEKVWVLVVSSRSRVWGGERPIACIGAMRCNSLKNKLHIRFYYVAMHCNALCASQMQCIVHTRLRYFQVLPGNSCHLKVFLWTLNSELFWGTFRYFGVIWGVLNYF